MQMTVNISILTNVYLGNFLPRKDAYLELIFKLLFCNDLHYILKKLPQCLPKAGVQVLSFTRFGANKAEKIHFSPPPQHHFLRNLEMGPDLEQMKKHHRKSFC